MRPEAHAVVVPVTATVSPVYLCLAPRNELLPLAWLAICRVTFNFNGLVTTKRLTRNYRYYGRFGYPLDRYPTEEELAVGRQGVLDDMLAYIQRHGVEIEELVIEESYV